MLPRHCRLTEQCYNQSPFDGISSMKEMRHAICEFVLDKAIIYPNFIGSVALAAVKIAKSPK